MADNSQNIESNKDKIQQMEDNACQLQKQGKYIECLEILEEILNLKRQIYGELSEEYQQSSQKLCELCNLIAMIFLQKEKFDVCQDFLQKAELLCHNSLEYKAVTMNNFACYYRKIGKLKLAIDYLKSSLEIEIKLNNSNTLADTHLNMCAILSQLSKHEEALQHALMSITLLQQEFMYHYSEEIINKENSEEQQQAEENNEQKLKERVVVLSIAYHNMGVELEYLKRYDEAIKTYLKAVNFAKENLEPSNSLIKSLAQVLEQALLQIENQKKQEKAQEKSKVKEQQKIKKSYSQANKLYRNPSSMLMNKRQFLGNKDEINMKGNIHDMNYNDPKLNKQQQQMIIENQNEDNQEL